MIGKPIATQENAGRLPTLSTHRPARLVTLFALYTAQGAPEGLLYVAVPAWLAAKGYSAAAIGGYIAVILLPWSLKLINGLVMDRWAFAAMGRRRPWLLGAQILLIATLAACAFAAPESDSLVPLTAIGFMVNFAGAFQDVAVDGMAIDVTPRDERARANGVMWGGKSLGIAGASVATGALIANYGLAAAALATALYVAAVMALPLLFRERPGEKLLPWTGGAAQAAVLETQLDRWAPLLKRAARAVLTPPSLVFAAGILVALAGYGLHTAFSPVAAVQALGWTDEGFTRMAGASNLAGGLFGVFLSGPIADRAKPHRALIAALAGMAVLHVALAAGAEYWAVPRVFAAYLMIYAFLFVLTSVSIYAAAMNRSDPSIAATQFSIYMAVLNLGTSAGAQRLGALKTFGGYEAVAAVIALVSIAAAGLFYAAHRLDAARSR